MKTVISILIFAGSSFCFGQTTRTFGINSYSVPTENGVTRYDKTYDEDGAYSIFYSALVGDSIFSVREQFEVKNNQPTMTAVYIEHVGLKNEALTYAFSPAKSDFEEGHAETWSVYISAKTAEGKTAFNNGHKWMIYPPQMPIYKESLGPGNISVYFSKRTEAKDFENQINELLQKDH